MTIKIGATTFDNVFCDADVDLLYLHIGDPSTAVDFDESPEGHALRFDTRGREGHAVVLVYPDDQELIVEPHRPTEATAA